MAFDENREKEIKLNVARIKAYITYKSFWPIWGLVNDFADSCRKKGFPFSRAKPIIREVLNRLLEDIMQVEEMKDQKKK